MEYNKLTRRIKIENNTADTLKIILDIRGAKQTPSREPLR